MTSDDADDLQRRTTDPTLVDPVVLALVNGEPDEVIDQLKAQTRARALDVAIAVAAGHERNETLENAFDGLHARYPAMASRDLPAYVLTLIRARALTRQAARQALQRAWVQTEFPQEALGLEIWVGLWRDAGYTSDSALPQPSEPLTLYRGAGTPAHVRGLSWTANEETARWFAARFSPSHGPGLVVCAEVAPGRVLARFEGRGEAEFVVDPRGLKVRTLR